MNAAAEKNYVSGAHGRYRGRREGQAEEREEKAEKEKMAVVV